MKTVSKVIFAFEDSETQIIFIRYKLLDKDLSKYKIRNTNQRRWFVGAQKKGNPIELLGWTDCNPNQTNAAEWLTFISTHHNSQEP